MAIIIVCVYMDAFFGYEAKKLCPRIILIVGNNRKYSEVCVKLREICVQFTPDAETYSIDEIFLDITGLHHLFSGPENLAGAIKAAVRSELALPVRQAWGRMSSSPSS